MKNDFINDQISNSFNGRQINKFEFVTTIFKSNCKMKNKKNDIFILDASQELW